MLNKRSLMEARKQDLRHEREMRARIRFDRSGQESISRRLEEMEMNLSDYVRHLVQKDIGVYV